MKLFFRRIHLYLGLVSGLVIATVCLTGSILVFEKELEQAFHPGRYFVEASGMQRPLAELVASAKAAKPDVLITGVKVFADPNRSVELAVGSPSGEKKKADAGRAKTEAGKGKEPPNREKKAPGKQGDGGRRTLYLNPYTAQVLDDYRYRDGFFYTVMSIHRGMVAGAVGKLVIGINAIVFLCIALTGLVLWWPATRNALTTRLRLKTSGSWKRLNHDLHVVLGFYFSLILMVSAFTGLAWSFEWFNDGIYWVTNSEKKRPDPPRSTLQGDTGRTIGFDGALARARQLAPEAASWSMQLPADQEESVKLNILTPDAAHDGATDEYILDRYSGRLLAQTAFAGRNLGQRVRGTFKPVHTWGYFGWPGKVVGLLACLFGFSAPVTGTILWWNRTRKAGKKKGKARAGAKAHALVHEAGHRAMAPARK